MDPKLFFIDRDQTFPKKLDPESGSNFLGKVWSRSIKSLIPDPIWLPQSSETGSGSNPKYLDFTQTNDF
jgi:hypothetical protein